MNKLILLTFSTALAVSACTSTEPSSDKSHPSDTKVEQRQISLDELAGKPQHPAPVTIPVDQVQYIHAEKQDSYLARERKMQSAEMAMMDSSTTMYYSAPLPAPTIYESREKYADSIISAIQQVATNPVSTFSVDVDNASYTVVRRFLQQGRLPEAGAVRVEELINYFDYQYRAPDDNGKHPFSIHTEVAKTPWNDKTHLMRVALKGKEFTAASLEPMNLVFLLDVSGSMNQPNKLPLLKRSFNLLVAQLRPQDHVSIVVYAGASGVVLEPTSGDKKLEITQALNNLQAGGSTHGSAGINLAYQKAQQYFNPKGINRVILATDGDFNVGTTSLQQLKLLIEQKRQSNVFLSILGFGAGNYNDELMEELSNAGNGVAYYIDSFKEARKVFREGLTGTLKTIAKDVKVQVEFNPSQVKEYRLVGYDNRALNNEDFNNDKVDAGDIGAGHTVTAFYEIVLADSDFAFVDDLRYQSKPKETLIKSLELAFVKLRYKQPDSDTSTLLQQAIGIGEIEPFESASKDFRFAASVAGFAEVLRKNTYVDWNLAELYQVAQSAKGEDTWGYQHDFLQLVLNAQAIRTPSPKGATGNVKQVNE